ncbi:MAG: hypothetical protein R2860_09925 [Desulfobacterales bacterium]
MILTLIIMVAAFIIASTLIMMVDGKDPGYRHFKNHGRNRQEYLENLCI